MRKIGIRYYDSLLTEENFKAMHEGGMTATELGLIHNPLELDFKRVRPLADRYNIDLWSAHLPFQREWPIIQKTAEERKWAYDHLCILIDRATDIGIDKFVIHSCWTTPDYISRDDAIDMASEALDRLADYAYTRGALLAVENLPTICFPRTCDELLKIISVNSKLRICFDVNHLFFDTHDDFIDKTKDKIITTHISDYDFVNEKHWYPGDGEINWPKLYNKLCESGYEGAWIYETRLDFYNRTKEKQITIRDVYNITMDIFSGKQPQRL